MVPDSPDGVSKRKLTARKILDFARAAISGGSPLTERRAQLARVGWLARHDSLTGLPNRLTLTDALGAAMRNTLRGGTHCNLLMIDLDRFKAVNDTLGHPVGDRLLQLVAERLAALINNDLCARLGGDEFAILMRDAANPATVASVAQAIIARLSEPYMIDNQVVNIGASIGIACGRRDDDTVDMLLRNADLALYRAKRAGGGRYWLYEPGLLAQAQGRRRLEVALREALAGNEFQLEFQPVVDARSEQLVSYEAQLRWQNPELGDVAVSSFMPLARQTGLIVPIGNWVIEQACLQAKSWPEEICVAVNVSGEQLADPQFCQVVARALTTANLAPERLEIEVTESIFMVHAATARAALEALMALGCAVTLNDFGTGYSSLSHIHRLQFSTIKLAASIVQSAAAGNRDSLSIIHMLVAMAQRWDIATTAEGVATQSELALARSLGCSRIQGIHFGRPVSGEDAAWQFSNASISETVAAG